MATLILTHDGIRLREYPLDEPVVTLGRLPDNDIPIDDVTVSGRHLRFVRSPNDYLPDHDDVYIEDLKSTNGTRVNGARICRQTLRHGDVIQVGGYRFLYDSGEAVRHEQTAIYLPDA